MFLALWKNGMKKLWVFCFKLGRDFVNFVIAIFLKLLDLECSQSLSLCTAACVSVSCVCVSAVSVCFEQVNKALWWFQRGSLPWSRWFTKHRCDKKVSSFRRAACSRCCLQHLSHSWVSVNAAPQVTPRLRYESVHSHTCVFCICGTLEAKSPAWSV